MSIRRLIREPLLQFLLLGSIIFAADYWLGADSSEQDIYRIKVTAQHVDALRANFKSEKGRLPSEEELQLRLQQWLDEQILYQQARVLGLDNRDAIVRRQMIQKMRFLLTDAVPVPSPTEMELQTFLDDHAERYGHSPRMSFEQVFLSRGRQAGAMGVAVKQVIAALQQAPEAFEAQGDSFPAGQVITAADEVSIRRDFGRDFYQRLLPLTDNEWHGPVASSLGLHMVRITGRTDFRPALLSEVRQRVENDWRLSQREQANVRAMEQLRRRFHIEYEGVDQQGAG